MIAQAQIALSLWTLLLGQASTKDESKTPQPLVSCILSTSEERADRLAKNFAVFERKKVDVAKLGVRECSLGGAEVMLVDESVFAENIGASFSRLLSSLPSEAGSHVLNYNTMDPQSKDSLRAILNRAPYNARFMNAYLDCEDPRIGLIGFSKIVLSDGTKTVTLPVYSGDESKLMKTVEEGGRPYEEVAKAADTKEISDRTEEEIRRRESARLVFRFMNYRNSAQANAEMLAKISVALAQEMKKEKAAMDEKLSKLAIDWFNSQSESPTWPPKNGSDFGALDRASKEKIESEFRRYGGNHGFASAAEADAFLQRCKVSAGYSDLMIVMANRGSASTPGRAKSYALSGTRW